ncbi:hypothetical protein D3C74_273750 [compost metagenome]
MRIRVCQRRSVDAAAKLAVGVDVVSGYADVIGCGAPGQFYGAGGRLRERQVGRSGWRLGIYAAVPQSKPDPVDIEVISAGIDAKGLRACI